MVDSAFLCAPLLLFQSRYCNRVTLTLYSSVVAELSPICVLSVEREETEDSNTPVSIYTNGTSFIRDKE